MKTSLYALAAAGLFVGGLTMVSAPARAADLGGSSDLEERVAELEATTVRKGNRKVSLELYGQINRALLIWDDGRDSDSYIVDNDHSPSRFGLKGSGTIGGGWKSGFWLEFAVNDALSSAVDNFKNFDEGNGETTFTTRQANLWIENDQFGRVTIGHGSSPTDDLTLINLSGAGVATDARTHWLGSFKVRSTDAGAGLQWRNIANGLDTDRGDIVRYDSPSVYGFILSAAWGENDQWDIALKFKKEWNAFRFAAGIGYYYQGDRAGALLAEGSTSSAGYGGGDNTRRDEWKGSLSAMHVPTGLYVTFAAGERSNFAQDGAYNPDQGFWYIQGGIDKRFLSYGATTLYGEYGNYSDFGAGNFLYNGARNTTAGLVRSGVENGQVASTDVDRWGLGVVQKFDASAMEVYALYQHWAADVTRFNVDERAVSRSKVNTEDFDGVAVGARIKF